MNVIEILNQIKNIKGSKAKVNFLRDLPVVLSTQEAADFKKVVEYTLDPMKSYYITSVPPVGAQGLFAVASPIFNYKFPSAINKLDAIIENGSASRELKQELSEIYHNSGDVDKQIIDVILSGDLKCGLGIKSFQEVWGEDFLPIFKVALIGSYNEAKIKKGLDFESGVFSQLKSDGARCIVDVVDGEVKLRSRNGKEILGLYDVKAELFNLDYDTIGLEPTYQIDGELVYVIDGVIQPREIGNGIVNKAIKGTITAEEQKNIRFIAWDLIRKYPYDEIHYGDRLKMLGNLCKQTNRISVTEGKIVHSLKEAKQHYQELVLHGEEGTILKNRNALWTPGDESSKRNQNGFKLKNEFVSEFKVVDVELGKKGSKYEGMVGSLVCESSCGQVKFKVGSGLKDSDRARKPDLWIDSIITVKYNGRIKPEGRDHYSLFLPRFIEERNDKMEADDLPKIISEEQAVMEVNV